MAGARFLGVLAMVAAAAGAARPASAGMLDRPVAERTVSAGDERIRCIRYRGFTVREVKEGSDIGSVSVGVIPARGSRPAACRPGTDPAARELSGFENMSFLGAKGRFLLLFWPDGSNGAIRFSIFDARTSKKLFSDDMKGGPEAFSRFEAGADSLRISYSRVVVAPCSLTGVDAGCWDRFAREARLPAEIARRASPTAVCATAYARHGLSGRDLDDPTVVSYDTWAEIDVSGGAKVYSGGALSCWSAE